MSGQEAGCTDPVPAPSPVLAQGHAGPTPHHQRRPGGGDGVSGTHDVIHAARLMSQQGMALEGGVGGVFFS